MQILAEPFTSLQDYLAWAAQRPEEEQYEVVDGQPVMSPSPAGLHQLVLARLGAKHSTIHDSRTHRCSPSRCFHQRRSSAISWQSSMTTTGQAWTTTGSSILKHRNWRSMDVATVC